MKSLKRPKSIMFFSILLLLSPALTVAANAYINMVPLWGAGNIFSRLLPTDLIILFIYPVAAFSVFSVRRTGWWIFIVSALLIMAYNIAAYVRNPMISLFGMILFNLAILAVAGFFFRKHIIAPYFNPRLRWWEQASRYDIELGVSLGIRRHL